MDGRVRWMLACLTLLALAAVGYPLIPVPDGIHQVWYDTISFGSLVLGFLGLLHHRPAYRRGWLLVLIGFSGWAIADVMSTSIETVLIPDQYPAPSDGVYLGSYLVLGIGVLALVRSRSPGANRAALLDASIFTTGAAVPMVTFVIAPMAVSTSLSLLGKVVSSAYPLGDLFLLGVLARMVTAPGARNASYQLLLLGLVASTGSDIAWNITMTATGSTDSTIWTDTGWLVSYVFVGSASCLPSMLRVAEPVPERVSAPTRQRLIAMTFSALLPGMVLLIDGAAARHVQWAVIGGGSILMSGLVIARMLGLLNLVRTQAEALEAAASVDALTGVPNRRAWDVELSRACRLSRELGVPLCVAMIDLDRFKAFNDAYGHQAGDGLLHDAARAWAAALPEEALLARYGGEEFAVLLPGYGLADACTVIERLQAVTPGEQQFSAGVARWDPDSDPGTVVAHADESLYRAKRAGRNRVFPHTEDDPDQHHASAPSLTMVMQPIVALATGQVVAHEALARFTGSDGDVQRVFQRAHAEGTGDLLELAAILAAVAVPGRPDQHELFVNASAQALASPRFWAGLPARLEGIVVELSEEREPGDLADQLRQVQRLRARGARIALDDVGGGGGEFHKLALIRPDMVKIDRSLVHGSASDPGRSAVLSGLVGYARYLGVEVCGEGVEDRADLDHLRRLGVTHAQGFLLARPRPSWQLTTAVRVSEDSRAVAAP